MSNPRKPVELKKKQGTDQPCRRGPRIAGEYRVPRKPHNLDPSAIPYWRKYAPMLAARGVLLPSDIPALADMCLVKARLDRAEKLLDEEMIIENMMGNKVRNPAAMVVSQYRHAWLVYCARFALTPSDRAGITIEPPEKELSLGEKLLAGRLPVRQESTAKR